MEISDIAFQEYAKQYSTIIDMDKALQESKETYFAPKPIDKNVSNVIGTMEQLMSKKKDSSTLANSITKYNTNINIEFEPLISQSSSPEMHYMSLCGTDYANNSFEDKDDSHLLPDSMVAQLYLAGVGILGLIVLHKLMKLY